MKHIFTISLCFLALSLSAQETITYPYNPDGDADGTITVPDLQDFLGNYGGAFSPSDILVDGETLATVLTNLQNSIDSLSALTGGSAGSVLDMPIGTVLPVASEAVPEGWMLCDGRQVAIEDYQELFDFIGTTYGAGDSAFWAQVYYPATTFNIPDLRGRTIIGADNMGGESAGVVSQHPSWLGKPGGAEMHLLTEDEMPSHSHVSATFSGVDYTDTFTGLGNGSIAVGENYQLGTSEESGGDQSHNNMQPYIALNYMVKVKAAFDVIEEMQAQLDSLSNSVENEYSVSQYGDTLYLSGGNYLIIPGLSQSNLHYFPPDYGSVSDADGNVYKTLTYGNKEWMVENLRTTTGVSDYVTPLSSSQDIPTYVDSIGYYYSAGDVNNNVCPSGWHIPSVSEWQDLHFEIYGTNMNPSGYTNSDDGYDDNNYRLLWSTLEGGTNQSFFNLFVSGTWVNSFGYISGYSDYTGLWSSTDCGGGNLMRVNFHTGNYTYMPWNLSTGCTSGDNAKSPIRCVHD